MFESRMCYLYRNMFLRFSYECCICCGLWPSGLWPFTRNVTGGSELSFGTFVTTYKTVDVTTQSATIHSFTAVMTAGSGLCVCYLSLFLHFVCVMSCDVPWWFFVVCSTPTESGVSVSVDRIFVWDIFVPFEEKNLHLQCRNVLIIKTYAVHRT
jgi:hypothetical protein